MIRPICKDILFLSQGSEPATPADAPLGQDLLDTLRAHAHECVGMAANMIGVKKRAIVVHAGFADLLMYNPEITQKAGPFEAEEGCLSLAGVRKTTRYAQITLRYLDAQFKPCTRRFTGWTAQIIQHEVDHLNGIII